MDTENNVGQKKIFSKNEHSRPTNLEDVGIYYFKSSNKYLCILYSIVKRPMIQLHSYLDICPFCFEIAFLYCVHKLGE